MKLGFNHIPKTGGTSLLYALGSSYPHYLSLTQSLLNAFSYKQIERLVDVSECIQFHVAEIVAFYPQLLNKIRSQCYFFSVIRNPIDRIISLWNHQWEVPSWYRGFCCQADEQPKDVYNIDDFIRIIYDKFPKRTNPINDYLYFYTLPETRIFLEEFLEQNYLFLINLDYLNSAFMMLKMHGLIPGEVGLSHSRKSINKEKITLKKSTVQLMEEKSRIDFDIYHWLKEEEIWLNPNYLEMLEQLQVSVQHYKKSNTTVHLM